MSPYSSFSASLQNRHPCTGSRGASQQEAQANVEGFLIDSAAHPARLLLRPERTNAPLEGTALGSCTPSPQRTAARSETRSTK